MVPQCFKWGREDFLYDDIYIGNFFEEVKEDLIQSTRPNPATLTKLVRKTQQFTPILKNELLIHYRAYAFDDEYFMKKYERL